MPVAMSTARTRKTGSDQDETSHRLAFLGDERLGGKLLRRVAPTLRVELGIPIEVAIRFKHRACCHTL
jgi:hypothetical protein